MGVDMNTSVISAIQLMELGFCIFVALIYLTEKYRDNGIREMQP